MNIRRILLVGGLLLIGPLLYGQSLERMVVSSGGSDATNPNGSLSYTWGQVWTSTIEVPGASPAFLTQGFQQPRNSDLVSVAPVPFAGMSIQLFPNPVVNHAQLVLRSDRPRTVEYCLIDARGRMLSFAARRIELRAGATETVVLDLQQLSQGSYLLLLRNPQSAEQTAIRLQKQ